MGTGADAASDRLRRWALRVWFAVGVVVLVGVSWWVLGPALAVVVPPLLWAVVIVYMLDPLVNAFERSGLHRFVGTLVAYLLTLAVAVLPVAIVLPALSTQLAAIIDRAPEVVTQVTTDAERWLGSIGVDVNLDSLQIDSASLPSIDGQSAGAAIAAVLGGLSGLAAGVVHVVLVLVLGPVIAFYTLVDIRRLRTWVVTHLPPDWRAEVTLVGRDLTGVIGGYLRGQLAVAMFVGTAVSLGMWLIDLPYWLLVGVIAGVTNLVPLLGPFVAGVVGGTIALAVSGPGLALLVVGILTLIQQIDNHLVSPLIMGQTVSLHPLMVIFALLVGSTLYGFVGLVVAVPFVAAGRVIVSHLWDTRVPWAVQHGPDPDTVEAAGPMPAEQTATPLTPQTRRAAGRTP